jgi:putative Mg2+ transporter-C (MgtC) family protein
VRFDAAATLWCSAVVGACAGSGEMFHAVFVTVLLLAINSILLPISRYIDQRSLAVLKTHAFYRVRLLCDKEHQVEAESQVTRATTVRSLVVREIPGRSMICTVILVRSARSWNVVGDLRSTGMCPA